MFAAVDSARIRAIVGELVSRAVSVFTYWSGEESTSRIAWSPSLNLFVLVGRIEP
jgi:hypothetical protein